MDTTVNSYRQSHTTQGKGEDYQADFLRISPRNLSWQIEQRILCKIVKRFFANKHVDYLDFACGTGRILAHLEGLVSTSAGVDIAPAMLKVARSRTSQSEILQADLTRETVLDKKQFDLITAFRFFPNAEPELRSEALDAIVSRLKNDGLLVFNNHRSTTFSRIRFARMITRGRRGSYGMSPTEVEDLLASKGLEIAATYHTGIVPESETSPFKPRWLVKLLEEVGTRLPLANIAGNIIYVCRKTR